MAERFEIHHTEPEDLDQVFEFFDASIQYQEKHGYPVWKNYDKNAVRRDQQNQLQYKVVADSEMAIVFSVCCDDKILWREREKGDALYLHRIVVNPKFKGQRLFGVILEWAIREGKQRDLKYIRMDTWAADLKIIDYYKGFGFEFIENYTTPDTDLLPVHNRNLALVLLELKVDN